MSYQEKKQKLQKIKSKESSARAELLALTNRRSVLEAEVSRAYDRLVQRKAERVADKRSDEDVQKAERAYLKLKDEQAEIDEKIDVQERVTDNLKDEVGKAETEVKRSATPYYQKQVLPHFVKINEALETIREEISIINSFEKHLQRDNVPKHVLRGITYQSEPAIRINKRGGSISMKGFITNFDI